MKCEKSGHHRPLPPPQDRRRIRAQPEHIKDVTTHPVLTREGGNLQLYKYVIITTITSHLRDFGADAI
jgi:hypothetical protein